MSDSTFASNGPIINTVPQSDAGIPAGADPMGDQKVPPPPGRLSGTIGTIGRYTVGGTTVGGLASIPSAMLDRSGYAMTIAACGGSVLGFLAGLSKIRADDRRAMIEAEAEPNRLARVEAERHHEECKAEREALRVTIADQGRKIEKLETSIEVERKRADGLTEMVVSLSERLNKVEAIRREAERRGDPDHERLAGGG